MFQINRKWRTKGESFLHEEDITEFVGCDVGCNSWLFTLLWTENRTPRLVCKLATATKDFVNKDNRSQESACAEAT